MKRSTEDANYSTEQLVIEIKFKDSTGMYKKNVKYGYKMFIRLSFIVKKEYKKMLITV